MIKNKILYAIILSMFPLYGWTQSNIQQLFDNKQYDEFFKIASVKAKQQDKEALFLLAKSYDLGLGTSQDLVEAIGLYKKAAELGEPRADNNLGVIYEKANKIQLAMKFYQQAYDAGLVSPPLSNLARTCVLLMQSRNRNGFYIDHEKILQEDKSCVQYNEKLYENDNSKNNLYAVSRSKLLFFIYSSRDNSAKNEALEWLDKSIAVGFIEAITNKGIYYQVLGDNDKAISLFKEAADKGQILAIYKMGEMLGSNNLDGLLWYSKAASKGSSGAVDKINNFIQYGFSYSENKKLSYQQWTTLLIDLEKYIEYIQSNKQDPITAAPIQKYDIDGAISSYAEVKKRIAAFDLIDQYVSSLQKNNLIYSTNNIVTMTRKLQSFGYIDANTDWKITTFSGDKILAQGCSSENGLVELRLTTPNNQKIIDYLNQGGILKFGYKQFVWFLNSKLENNVIDLTLNVELTQLVNISNGKAPDGYIIDLSF